MPLGDSSLVFELCVLPGGCAVLHVESGSRGYVVQVVSTLRAHPSRSMFTTIINLRGQNPMPDMQSTDHAVWWKHRGERDKKGHKRKTSSTVVTLVSQSYRTTSAMTATALSSRPHSPS